MQTTIKFLGYITAPTIAMIKDECSFTYFEETFRFFKEQKRNITANFVLLTPSPV